MNDAAHELPSVISFSENIADAQPPKPIPTGTYRASVKMSAVGPSKSSGRRTLTLTLHVTPDQYPADYTDGNPDGTILMHYVSVEDTPQGRFNTRRICEVFDVPMVGKDINAMDFMNRECYAKVMHEPYEGAMQAKIERGGLSAA